MKTWQMIKELTENPNKRFTSDFYEAYVYEGLLEVMFNGDPADFAIAIERKWEEVKVPVTFIEALKAAAEGSNISLKSKEISPFYGCKMIFIFEYIVKNYGSKKLFEMMLNGKWYIED